MSSTPAEQRCLWMDQLSAYALTALPASEAAAMAAHLATCAQCRQELEAINPTIDALAAWQGDLLPSTQLWDRVVERIAIASDERPRRWTMRGGSSRNGKRSRRASLARCLRPIRSATASACSCGSRPESSIHRTSTREWKSSTFWTASCGSTTESSIPATTIVQSPVRPMRASGARPAAPAFSLHRRLTCCADEHG